MNIEKYISHFQNSKNDKNRVYQKNDNITDIEIIYDEYKYERKDQSDKMKLVTKRMIDDFSLSFEILKKIYKIDLDYEKLKELLNNNSIANGKLFLLKENF